jgi:hypothetical protein
MVENPKEKVNQYDLVFCFANGTDTKPTSAKRKEERRITMFLFDEKSLLCC